MAAGASPAKGESLLTKYRPKGTESAAEGAQQPDSPAPDWLERIRQKAKEDRDGLSGIFSADEGEEDETPDWLEAIKSDTPLDQSALTAPAQLSETKPEPGAQKEEEIPSWSGEAQLPPQDDDDTEAWLKSLEAAAAPVQWKAPSGFETLPAGEEASEEEPGGWIPASDLESSLEPAPAEESSGAIPDWLAGLEDETAAAQAQESGLTDEEQPEAAAEPADELPDWLAGLEDETPAAQAQESGLTDEEQPEAGAAPADELPDWLAGLEGETAAAQQPAPAAEIPDWINRTLLGGEEAAAEEDRTSLEELKQELPEWLKGKQLETDSENDQTVSSWLDSFRETSGQEETPPLNPAAAPYPESPGPAAEEAAEGASAQAGDSGTEAQGGWLAGFIPIDETPAGSKSDDESDFWRGLGKSQPAPEAPPDLSIARLSDSFDPLAEFSEETTSEGEEAVGGEPGEPGESGGIEETATSAPFVSPFTASDLPEWLTGVPHPAENGETAETGDLAPADLPDWLKAMRPVESISPASESQEEVAKSGPLAGLQGVLPGEKFVLSYGKPPVYSARLKVSERQRAQANLLETMLAQLQRPVAAAGTQTPLGLRLGRMAAGLVLLLVVVVMNLLPGSLFPPPSAIPAAAADFHNQMENLPAGGTLLLVIDYDPSFAGELPLAARPVIERLMAREMRLAVVSANPSGQALAEDLLARAAAVTPGFDPDSQIFWLGYLPGGATGIRQFADRPRSVNSPNNAWLSPALSTINRLEDFSAVLLLTDSLEGAQKWIEQTSGKLGSAPFLAVTSAQAAPVLSAYYRAGQLNGMLEGIPAAAAYGILIGRPVTSAAWWNSYQAGLLVMLAAVALGGLWQLLSRLTKKKAS